ncbi:MAG: helix-turn-helix domain-containing protein [Muribaculaceae bacterium]|nr:helix-turn-helix domain-containing protein [Muribaculaceae bacterium]
MTQLKIKNMVCRHCVSALAGALEKLGIAYTHIGLGEATVPGEITMSQLRALDTELDALGFERIDSPEQAIVEKVKHAVLHHVRNEAECRLKLSACIEEQLGMPYDTVSRLFSQIEGRTIEKYHIAQKVERVKELLLCGQSTLDEIADITGYSSGAHLSRQFKTVTGLTPTEFCRGRNTRRPADEV